MNKLHPSFRIHGEKLNEPAVVELAYSFIKEGLEFEQQIGSFLLDWMDVSSEVEVQTSGSTGIPKSIFLKKQRMINSALATGSYFDLKPNDSALLCLPASYIAGKMMLVRAMVLGLDIYFVPPTSTPLHEHLRTYDFGAMVPLQVANSLADLHNIKIILVGGAPVTLELRNALSVLENTIFETYGMTETITHIAVKALTKRNTKSELEPQTFKTLPKVSVSKNEQDCLVIHAPEVSDDVVVTNDVVELISSTQFIWLGRFDNVINSGGVKIHPEHVEAKLSSTIESPFFIGSLPHKLLGSQVVLVVEGTTDTIALMEKIRLNKSLNTYEIPKIIKTLAVFSRTESGKIKRKETMALLR